MAWELLTYLGPDGKPVDLVPHDVPANQPKPFSLKLDDAAKSARLNTRAVCVCGERLRSTLTQRARDDRVRVSGRRGPARTQAIPHRAEFLRGDRHHQVTDGGRAVNPFVHWGPGLGDVLAIAAAACSCRCASREAIFSVDGEVERIQAASSCDDAAVSRAPTSLPASIRTTSCRCAREAGQLPSSSTTRCRFPRKRRTPRCRATTSATTSASRRRRTDPRPCGSSSDRSISKRCGRARSPIWCARSGSACSRFSACRCSRR